MVKIKQWFVKNSSFFQSVAALIVIVASLPVIPYIWGRAFSPSLVLEVNFDESTLPPDLVKWMTESEVLLEETSFPEDRRILQERLANLRKSLTATRLKAWYPLSSKIDRLTLTVRNQSEHSLTGIRIRISDVRDLWSSEV